MTVKKKVIIEIDLDTKGYTKELQKANEKVARLTKSQSKLRKEGREGSIQYAKNKVALAKYRAEANRLTKTLAGTSKAAKVANKSFFRLGNLFKGGLGLLGIGTAVMGVWRAFGDAFQRIREYDKEMQNMAGISRTSRSELEEVEKTIQEVAGSSIKTSNEVAKLATTLFSLGKTKEEVIAMLKPVNDLSIALNTTGDEAADFLGQTLNAFGKGAESSQEFADIIANVRSSSALDFERIKVALGFIAPTANALGETLGQTAAKMATLQDNGIRAARAGRLMSTSYLKLADEGNNLSESLDKLGDKQTTLLSNTDRLALASKIFGKEAAPLALILADNREKTDELANSFDNLSDGALKKLTEEQLESMDAHIKGLDSAYEKFILGIENGEGVISQGTKSILKWGTAFLNTLTLLGKTREELDKMLFEQALAKKIEYDLKDVKFYAEQTLKENETLNHAKIREARRFQQKLRDERSKVNFEEQKIIDARIEALQQAVDKEKAILSSAGGGGGGGTGLTDAQIKAMKKASKELAENAKKAAFDSKVLTAETEQAKLDIIYKAAQEEIEALYLKSERTLEDEKAKNRLLEELKLQHIYRSAQITKKADDEAGRYAWDRLSDEIDAITKAGKEKAKAEKKNDELALEQKEEFWNTVKEGSRQVQQDISDEIFRAQSERISRERTAELNAADLAHQTEKDGLNARLSSNQITEEEYDRRALEADRDFEAAQLKIKKEAFEKDKKLKKQEVAINLVIELVNLAVAASGNPTNEVTYGAAGAAQYAATAAIAVARSAVQLAAIESSKFADGGILSGPSHDNGGIPFTVAGKAGFEAEGEEIILTKGVSRNPALLQMASNINEAGGGAAFGRGTGTKFADGGSLANSVSSNVENTISLLNQQRKISAETAPPVVDVKDIIRAVNQQIELKDSANL